MENDMSLETLETLVSEAEITLGSDGHSDAAALLRRTDRSDQRLIHSVAVRGLLIARSHSPESPSVDACRALADATKPAIGYPPGGGSRLAGGENRIFSAQSSRFGGRFFR